MSYNLTDNQKDVLGWIVLQVRSGFLTEEFGVYWHSGGRGYSLTGYTGDEGALPGITQGVLDALAAEGMIHCSPDYGLGPLARPYEIGRKCVLTGKACQAVDNDFEMPSSQVSPQLSIGAYIEQMSGGNVQGVGVADHSEISQIVNDPALLQSQVEELTAQLLDAVKSELTGTALEEYAQSVRDIREGLTAEEPDPSLLKRLAGKLAFLADIEGTISLAVRVWLIIYPLLLIAAERLSP